MDQLKISRRIEFWDIFKGMAIMLVVLSHAIQKCNGGDYSLYWQRLIMTFHMPLFFMLAGYWFSAKRVSAVKGIWSKVKRLLVPYLLWNTVYYLISDSYSSYWLCTVYSRFWFLRTLFLVYLCAYTVDVLASRVSGKWIKYCVAIFALSGLMLLSYFAGYGYVVCKYTILFYCGAGWYEIRKRFSPNVIKYVVVAGAILYIAECIVYRWFDWWVLDQKMALTGVAFVVSVSWLIDKYASALIKRVFCWFGVNSLGVYAVHWILLFACGIIDWAQYSDRYGMFAMSLLCWIVWLVLSFLSISALRKIPGGAVLV